MPLIVNELQRRGLKFRCWSAARPSTAALAGASFTRKTATPYEPGVFYCKDAFEGLATMDALMDAPGRAAGLLKDEAAREAAAAAGAPCQPPDRAAGGRQLQLRLRSHPQPPTWGPRVVRRCRSSWSSKHLFKNELFRLSWGAKNAHGEEWERLKAEFEPAPGAHAARSPA
jgi:5-methyltetrahydrofolate--homocysteine methyltransferase